LNLGNTDVAAIAAHLAGDLAYEGGEFGRAIEFYNVVLTRHQSSDEFKPVVISAMWAMLKARRFDALAKHFEQYNAKLDINDRAAAWFLAGRAQQELGDHQKAASLFAAGTRRIAQKVGEEAVELALAATAGDRDEQLDEAADLLYHLLVLLAAKDLSLADVAERLEERHSG